MEQFDSYIVKEQRNNFNALEYKQFAARSSWRVEQSNPSEWSIIVRQRELRPLPRQVELQGDAEYGQSSELAELGITVPLLQCSKIVFMQSLVKPVEVNYSNLVDGASQAELRSPIMYDIQAAETDNSSCKITDNQDTQSLIKLVLGKRFFEGSQEGQQTLNALFWLGSLAVGASPEPHSPLPDHLKRLSQGNAPLYIFMGGWYMLAADSNLIPSGNAQADVMKVALSCMGGSLPLALAGGRLKKHGKLLPLKQTDEMSVVDSFPVRQRRRLIGQANWLAAHYPVLYPGEQSAPI